MALELFRSLPKVATKQVLLLRHGELSNPSRIVYNRDSIMQRGEEIHLSIEGKRQMWELGDFIKEKGIRIKMIISSPEIRTLESAQELQNFLELPNVEISRLLDDMYAPGPYLEGMNMGEIERIRGNVYDKKRWELYNHETPAQAIERMRSIFNQVTHRLNLSEACVLVSHGDPIAWFANTVGGKKNPTPQSLRNKIYPSKGNGIIYLLDGKNNIVDQYMLRKREESKIF